MPDAPIDAELTVAQLGEFGLIDRLARILNTSGRDPSWRCPLSRRWLALRASRKSRAFSSAIAVRLASSPASAG